MTARHASGPDWLQAKLRAGNTVVIDGAMGTELQARGVAMHAQAWSAMALLSDPEQVLAAHCDYIRAGAEVIIANTFSSARHMLEPAGLTEQVGQINARAMQLAREARDCAAASPVAIAGSICEWVHQASGWDDARLRASFEEQAGLLAAHGAELLIVEMAQHPRHSPMAIEAALGTGLPVWAGVSCRRHEPGGELRGFDHPDYSLNQILAAVSALDIGLLAIMHSPIADTGEALTAAREYWPGALGAYPESGHFRMPNWEFVDVIEPDELVAQAAPWLAQGVQVIGGCCGLSVPHVRALARAYGQPAPATAGD